MPRRSQLEILHFETVSNFSLSICLTLIDMTQQVLFTPCIDPVIRFSLGMTGFGGGGGGRHWTGKTTADFRVVVGEGRGGHWTGKTTADFRVVVGEGRGGHWTGKTTADFRVVVGGKRWT